MNAPKIRWIKIADHRNELNFQSNGMCIVDAEGKKVTIAVFNDALFAFTHKCPHAGGILADGFMDATGNVVCPLHRYKFSVQTGRNVTGEGYYMTRYRIDEKADGVYVGFEQKSLFSF